ncbi:hypothetical protein E8E12_007452 [Didymella heteroderae]|uniref:UBA domain-containing protein n=1 Tax=Didymella heteroderae TaxID=1769908 RepID=A0A9P5C1B9_9PLEO|nr:hypothetical protein E8E12_007452 [Didymella heteroderae]
MSRVIQDSDDELDDDLEVEVQQTEAKDASPKQSDSNTSSTEALRRQIEAAHRAHLQSQFPMTDNQTSAALEDNNQKRKIPPEFDLYSQASGHAAPKKSPITYAKRAKSIFVGSPGDLRHEQNLIDQTSQPGNQQHETYWGLEGTVREAYAQHNPNTMFPEPSSTVPNATLTQQRVLDGILAPVLLGSEVDAGRTSFHPDASIPWSEYLKSPTNTEEQPKSSAQASRHTSLPAPGTLLNDGSDISISQPNRRESLMLVGCLSTQDKSTGMVDNHQELTVFPVDEVAPEATLPQINPFPTAHEPIREKTPASSRSTRKMKRIPSPGPISDDDLADLGLPKEQYKPRPSRSRSLKTNIQESIDYSIRSERATKANRRRKSTPAMTSVASFLSTPERIQQICDMGFTPYTSAKALKQNNGDVTQSVDWLITNRVADDELVCHTSQMSQDDHKQVAASLDPSGYDGDPKDGHTVGGHAIHANLGTELNTMTNKMATAEMNDASSVVHLKSPAKVQVVIPPKSFKATTETAAAPEIPRKKAKRRNTTLDQPKPTANNNAVTEAGIEEKRGRGRPKKAAKTISSTELVLDEKAAGPGDQGRDSPLNCLDGNAQPTLVQQQAVEDTNIAKTSEPVQVASSEKENAKTAIATSSSTPEPQQLPDRPEVEPITPKRAKQPVPREQPLNNIPKVPYRVGLSKRTRIAPLLRVIKK